MREAIFCGGSIFVSTLGDFLGCWDGQKDTVPLVQMQLDSRIDRAFGDRSSLENIEPYPITKPSGSGN